MTRKNATKRRNTDDHLRSLERLAATGDAQARARLARHRSRMGIAAWDDHAWAMSDEGLTRSAQHFIEMLEQDARRRALIGYSAAEREVLNVARARNLLSTEWMERLATAQALLSANLNEARSRRNPDDRLRRLRQAVVEVSRSRRSP